MLDAPSIGMISGAALVGVAGLRVAWECGGMAVRQRAAEVRTRRRRREFGDQLDAAIQWARASQPALRAWTGMRPFRVAAVVDETHDCRSYYLVPEDGRPLPRFEPGQYLTFHLPSTDRTKSVVRCYSLSERPREDFYRVTVKRISSVSGTPNGFAGRGSGFFHREVRPGSILNIEAPQGAFFLDPTDDRPIVLCGAGVGITPLVSMASELVYQRDRRRVYLFAGFRSGHEHIFRAWMAQLRTESKRLRVDVSYSRPTSSDRLAPPGAEGDYQHQGRVCIERIREVLPSSNFRFYVCGPAGMMESLVPALIEWGVPAEHVRFEAFGPATVRGLGGAIDTAACEVQFARSGKIAPWTGEQGSLLELAEQTGIPLDSGCRAGSCGQCRVMLAAGKVVHAKTPGAALIDGECLACIARPQGDVVVEA